MATLTTPTLQNLVTNARIMLKQQDPKNSTWTDEELLLYVNDGIRMYFLEASMVNEGLFTTTTDLTITSGVETVALPSDFFQAKNVWKKVNDGYLILNYRNSVDSDYSTQGGTSGNNYQPYYYFRGNNLVLRPTPNFTEVAGIKLEYIQFPDNMVYSGDSLTAQIAPVFKQLIEAYVVYRAKLTESMVSNVNTYEAASANLQSIYGLFKATLQNRSKNPTYVLPFNPEDGV